MVNEVAAVRALQEKRIAGYATDVLYPAAEKASDYAQSPLWSYYLELCGDQYTPPLDGPNLLILPHIGGSVFSLFASLLDELLPQMFAKLGVNPSPSDEPPSTQIL